MSIFNSHFSYLLLICSCFFLNFQLHSQINFCPGNTGEAIFEENFGQGTTNGPPLGPEVTSYTYVNQGTEDGQYTISSNLMQLAGFHNIPDHTGNQNGKALIVNADFEAGLFYQIPIDGLCENNSYEFSAYLVNLYNASTNFCPGSGIPVNVRFQIWDETDTILLAQGDTGDINGSFNTPSWQAYGVTFETLAGQTSVILKMLNNGDGGCGNDLAIDDIVFRSCGDLTEIVDENNSSSITFCENDNVNTITLSAVPDFSVYDTHFYQWQQSEDNENWQNIAGETSEDIQLNIPDGTQFYRVLVAEDLVNVNNTLCNSTSNVFQLSNQELISPISLGNVEVCEGEEASVAVQSNPNIQIDWYDAAEGGNLLLENSFSYSPDEAGTYYAQSTTLVGECVQTERVPVRIDILESPETNSELFEICPNESIELDAELQGVTYLWSTEETSPQITVDQAGIYSVERTTSLGCTTTKTFEVIVFQEAIIQDIRSENTSIVLELENPNEFLFSLDGQNYQSSTTFENTSGGLYEIRILSENCGERIISYVHLVIPRFFTPNEDGFNDVFRIATDRFYDSFSIQIFDRYGKLLISTERAPFAWDGTYNGKILPSQDYWYKITIEGKVFTGNVSLIR